jgi:dCTP deaminase
MILIDRHIADLCRGVVPDELRFYYSSLWADIPRHCLPMVEPFDPSLVNPASLDIRVGYTAKLRRKYHESGYADIDLSMQTAEDPLPFQPGDRLLVASLETINLPNFLCAQFRLKSSRGREWYEHMEAGFCDPGWHGSKLTMEIINMDLAPLPIYPGLKMGQLVFSLTLAPPDQDYSVRGRYNNDRRVMESKG